MAVNLWKPYGKNTGNAVFLSTENWGSNISIVDASTGEILATGRFDKKYDDGRYIYRFNAPGNTWSNIVVISDTGKHVYVPNGGKRYDGLPVNQAKANSQGYLNKHPNANRFDFASFVKDTGGAKVTDVDPDGISNKYGVVDPQLLDINQLSFNRFEFKDPIETLRTIAAENKGQVNENLLLSMQHAGLLNEANTNQLIDYLNTMTPVQMQLVGIENAFNQQQKLQAAETAMPGIQNTLNKQIKDAETLASGRLLSSVEDNALEQIARSAGADNSWSRGLGDNSLVGKRLSDQLSVSQRMQLMQQGENYMNTATQLAATVLMDSPNKAMLSQQISGAPAKTFSDLAQVQQQTLNSLSTMSPTDAQNFYNKQTEYDYQLQSEYNKYAFDIMAANAQAINTFNQDVVNARTQQENASKKNLAIQQAYYAAQKRYINPDELRRILAEIESTGTVNMGAYVTDWDKKWAEGQSGMSDKDKKDASEWYNNGGRFSEDQQNETNAVSTEQQSTSNSTVQPNNVIDSTGNTITNAKELQEIFNKWLNNIQQSFVTSSGTLAVPVTQRYNTNSQITAINNYVKSNASQNNIGSNNLGGTIIHSNGTITTIPTMYMPQVTTYMEYINYELQNVDLSGVI